MDSIAKKVIIVYILKVLYNYTSVDHTVTQTQITRYLNDIDIPCDRKTVGRNIKYLIDVGVPVLRKPGKNGGYYYDIENDKFFVRGKMYD